jgi:hypothetical protein
VERAAPIRAKRQSLETNIDSVWDLLREQSYKAESRAEVTMKEARSVLGVSRGIGDLRERFAAPIDHEIATDADFAKWSKVDSIINSYYHWDEYVPQFQIHWWRKMVPREIALKRPAQNFENEERNLEEPFMTSSGKRVLVRVSNSGPELAQTLQGLVKTWHFSIPQRSYDAWVLLLYDGDSVPTKIPNANGVISAFVVPQKFFARDFASAKRSSKASDKIPVKVMRNEGNRFFFGFEQFGRLADITALHGDYDPLR